MMKKILGTMLVLSLVLTMFAGCGTKEDTAAEVTKQEDTKQEDTKEEVMKPVNITVSHVQGEWLWPILEELGQQYAEKTGNTVEFIYVPAEAYEQWVQTQVIAGSEPDIMWGLGATPSDNMLANDQILDLREAYAGVSPYTGAPWQESFLDGFLEDLFINSGVVEKLDVMTVNDRLEMSEIVLGVKTGVIDPADQRFVDYFSYMKELSQYFNKGFNTMMWEYEKLFNDGQAAMQLNGSWYPNQHLTAGFDVNYGTGANPYADSSISELSRNEQMKYAVGVGGPDLVVTAKSVEEGRADAAIDFLRFLTDPNTGAKYFVEKTMFLPVVKGVEVPEVMKGIVGAIGTDEYKTNMSHIFTMTAEEGQIYEEMFKVFLEDDMSAEDFIVSFKLAVLDGADQYIIGEERQWI